MKTGWKNRPDNWPAPVQFALAGLSQLVPVALLISGQNAWSLGAIAGMIGFWCWLGRNGRGFPFLFDFLSLQVFITCAVVGLIAAARLVKSLLWA